MSETEKFKPNEIVVDNEKDGEGRPMTSISVNTTEARFNANFSPWQGVSENEGQEDPWKEAAKLFEIFVRKNLNNNKQLERAFGAFVEWDKNCTSGGAKVLEELLKPGSMELVELNYEEERINDEIEKLAKERDALFEEKFPGMSEVKKVLSEAATVVEVSVLSGSAENLLKVLFQGETKAGPFEVISDPSNPLVLEEDGAWGNKKGDVFTPERIAEGIFVLKEEGTVRISPIAVERLYGAIKKNEIYFDDNLKRVSFPMQWEELK